jgi:ATP-dependent Lon protease
MSKKNKNSTFQMIADIEGDIKDIFDINTPGNVSILPVRSMVLFPGVVSPILIGRESSKVVIQKAEKKDELLGVICQRYPDVNLPFQD